MFFFTSVYILAYFWIYIYLNAAFALTILKKIHIRKFTANITSAKVDHFYFELELYYFILFFVSFLNLFNLHISVIFVLVLKQNQNINNYKQSLLLYFISFLEESFDRKHCYFTHFFRILESLIKKGKLNNILSDPFFAF